MRLTLHGLPQRVSHALLRSKKMKNFKKIIVVADHSEYGLGSAVVEVTISKEEYTALKELDKDCVILSKKHNTPEIRVLVKHIVKQDISDSLKRLDIPLSILEDSYDGFGELTQALESQHDVKEIEDLDLNDMPDAEKGVLRSGVFYSTVGRHIEFETPFKHAEGGYESVMHLGYISIDELDAFFEKEVI